MSPSRWTLARTEAAATTAQCASALTLVRTGGVSPGGRGAPYSPGSRAPASLAPASSSPPVPASSSPPAPSAWAPPAPGTWALPAPGTWFPAPGRPASVVSRSSRGWLSQSALPSRSTTSGRWPRAATCARARRPASLRAPTMPWASISPGVELPRAQSSSHCRHGPTRSSRRRADRSLESARPAGKASGVAAPTTARPTVTGPASAPRPTSSIPPTSGNRSMRARSTRRSGTGREAGLRLTGPRGRRRRRPLPRPGRPSGSPAR